MNKDKKGLKKPLVKTNLRPCDDEWDYGRNAGIEEYEAYHKQEMEQLEKYVDSKKREWVLRAESLHNKIKELQAKLDKVEAKASGWDNLPSEDEIHLLLCKELVEAKSPNKLIKDAAKAIHKRITDDSLGGKG